MDIGWNTTYHAYPTTSNYIGKDIDKANTMAFIPVIFITNETLLHTTVDELDTLSNKIVLKTKKLCGENYSKIKEIQIDCDWTPMSKDIYFELLQKIKQKLNAKLLSVTLRLHQLKYKNSTGIPPADRATLMLYNMGKLTDYNEQNSILNLEESKSYLRSETYDLPMDFILPLFDWGVEFKNKEFYSLIHNIKRETLDTNRVFKKMPNGNYSLITDYYEYLNSYFSYGDEIRLESISKKNLLELSGLCKALVSDTSATVSFFDMYHYNKIDSASYEEIYHHFN